MKTEFEVREEAKAVLARRRRAWDEVTKENNTTNINQLLWSNAQLAMLSWVLGEELIKIEEWEIKKKCPVCGKEAP